MDDFLQPGVEAFKSGDKANARKLIILAVKQNPNSERTWGWMYNVCLSDRERIECLRQMLRLNPQNQKALQLLSDLTTPDTFQTHAPQPPENKHFQTSASKAGKSSKSGIKKPRNLFLIILGALFLGVCLCVGIALLVVTITTGNPHTPTPVIPAKGVPLPTRTTVIDQTATVEVVATATLEPNITVIPAFTSRPTWTLEPTKTPFVLATIPAAPSRAGCRCASDTYNCSDFPSQASAQACFNACLAAGRGDIHRLDQNNNGLACENN